MSDSDEPQADSSASTLTASELRAEQESADASVLWKPDAVSEAHPSHYVLSRIEAVVAGSLVVAVFVLVLLQVLTRYVFSSPLSWAEEAARLCLVWLTFSSAAFVSSRSSHIAVDIFDRLLSPRTGRMLRRIVNMVVAVASAFLVYAGISLLLITWHLRLPATDVPTPILYGAATLCFALMTLHSTVWAIVGPDEPVADVPEGL